MIRPVVDAMLAKVPGDVRNGVKTIVAGLSDADAVEFMKTGWGVTATSAEIMRGLNAQRATVEHGHAGGVKTARKRRMGLIPAADPAGAKWKPDYRSPLNRAVFPTWGKIPKYIPSLVPFMSPAVAKTVIIIGAVVDHRGDFELPRAQHAEAIGLGARKAYGGRTGPPAFLPRPRPGLSPGPRAAARLSRRPQAGATPRSSQRGSSRHR